jgi:membrane associated rhomboid family serine protease
VVSVPGAGAGRGAEVGDGGAGTLPAVSEHVSADVCYRHPHNRAGVRCQRCERLICPDCMRSASVGFHCPECTRQGKQQVYTARSLPGGGRPVVTLTLIGMNALVFLADLMARRSTPPEDLTIEGGLIGGGQLPTGEFIGVDVGEWWRIFSSGFLHADLVHLGFNMAILYLLGSQLEPALGRTRFGLVYVVGLIGGSFGALLMEPRAFTVGASGAVFALMGAAFVLQRSMGINPFDTGLGGLIAINVVISFLIPGISIGGHLGGLLAGAMAGWLLVELPPKLAPGGSARGSPAGGLAVATALTALVGVALFAGCLWAASEWMSGGVI